MMNILLQETFNKFQDKLNFKLSYQDYKKILLLMKKEHLSNINYYINVFSDNIESYIYISYINIILSYYSDIYLKTNIQNYNFCLEAVKHNGWSL